MLNCSVFCNLRSGCSPGTFQRWSLLYNIWTPSNIWVQIHCWSSHCVGLKTGWKSGWELNWSLLLSLKCLFGPTCLLLYQGGLYISSLLPTTIRTASVSFNYKPSREKRQCCLVVSTLWQCSRKKRTHPCCPPRLTFYCHWNCKRMYASLLSHTYSTTYGWQEVHCFEVLICLLYRTAVVTISILLDR